MDLAASSFGLLLSACVVVGLGLLLRSASDCLQARLGGRITGFVTGDRLEDDEDPDTGLRPQPASRGVLRVQRPRRPAVEI